MPVAESELTAVTYFRGLDICAKKRRLFLEENAIDDLTKNCHNVKQCFYKMNAGMQLQYVF